MEIGGVPFDGFAWDSGNRDKCRKHGVSLAEIESLFVDGDPFVLPDTRHSLREQRLLAIGRSAGGRHLYVVFTMRQVGLEVLLRPISARYMHAKEVRAYAEARARVQQ